MVRWPGRDNTEHVEDCACVAIQRLPDHWRPARYFVDDGGPLSRGLVFIDREDMPRSRYSDEIASLPDVPDWWRLDGTITISSAQFAAGDMVEVDGVVHTITAVDGDNITVQFWR